LDPPPPDAGLLLTGLVLAVVEALLEVAATIP